MVPQGEFFPDFSTNQLLLRQGHRVKNGRASPSWLFLSFAGCLAVFGGICLKKYHKYDAHFLQMFFRFFGRIFQIVLSPSPVDKRLQEQREGQARLFARVNSSHAKPVYQLYGFHVDQSRGPVPVVAMSLTHLIW